MKNIEFSKREKKNNEAFARIGIRINRKATVKSIRHDEHAHECRGTRGTSVVAKSCIMCSGTSIECCVQRVREEERRREDYEDE